MPGRLATTLGKNTDWSGPADTTGGAFASTSVTVASSDAESAPSDAVSRRRYVPGVLNVTVVAAAAALPKVTEPGPETSDQATVRVEPTGRPSSVAKPARLATVTGDN